MDRRDSTQHGGGNWRGGRGGRGRFGGRNFGGGRARGFGRGGRFSDGPGARGGSGANIGGEAGGGGSGGISSYAALASLPPPSAAQSSSSTRPPTPSSIGGFDNRSNSSGGRDYRDHGSNPPSSLSRPLMTPRDRRQRSLSPADSASRRMSSGSGGGGGERSGPGGRGSGGPAGGYHRPISMSGGFDGPRGGGGGGGGGAGGDRRESSNNNSNNRDRDADTRPKTQEPPSRASVASATKSNNNDDDSSGYESGEVSPSPAPPTSRPRTMDVDRDSTSYDGRDRFSDDGDRSVSRRFEAFDDRDRLRDRDRDRDRPPIVTRYSDDRGIDRPPFDRDIIRPGRGGAGGFEGRGGRGGRFGDGLGRGGRGRPQFYDRDDGGRGDSSSSAGINRQELYGQRGRDDNVVRDGPRDMVPHEAPRDKPRDSGPINDMPRDRLLRPPIDKDGPRDIAFRPGFHEGRRDGEFRGPSREAPRIMDSRNGPRGDPRTDIPRDRDRGPLPPRDFGLDFHRGEPIPPPRGVDRYHNGSSGPPSSGRIPLLSGSYSSLLNNTDFAKELGTPEPGPPRLDDRFAKRRHDDLDGADNIQPGDKRQRTEDIRTKYVRPSPSPDVDEFGRPLLDGRNLGTKRDDQRHRLGPGAPFTSLDDRRPESVHVSRLSSMVDEDPRHPSARMRTSGSSHPTGDPRTSVAVGGGGGGPVARGFVGGQSPIDHDPNKTERLPIIRDKQPDVLPQERAEFRRTDNRVGGSLGRRDNPGPGPPIMNRPEVDRAWNRPSLSSIAREEQLQSRNDMRPPFDNRNRSPVPPTDQDRSMGIMMNEASNTEERAATLAPEGRGSFQEGVGGWIRGGRGMVGRGFRGRGRGGGRFVPNSHPRSIPPREHFPPDGPGSYGPYSGLDRQRGGDAERPFADGQNSFDQHRRRSSFQKDTDRVTPSSAPSSAPSSSRGTSVNERDSVSHDTSNPDARKSKEEAKPAVPRNLSPPPKVEPSGIMTAMIRLAELEAQMEYAYAKHMLLVKKRAELQLQHKLLKDLPVGIEAIQEDLDELMAVVEEEGDEQDCTAAAAVETK